MPYLHAKRLKKEDFYNILHDAVPFVINHYNFNFVSGNMLLERQRRCCCWPIYLKRETSPDFSTKTLELI